MESPVPSSIIDRDLPCGRCGYNLRTLAATGKCPECGTAVARTIRGDVLAAANPRWRGGLRVGLTLLAAGLGSWVALQVVAGQGYESIRVTRLMIAATLVLGALGVWLVSEPEPDALHPERPWARRKFIRWGSLGVAAMYVASPFFGIREALFNPNPKGLVVQTTVLAVSTVLFVLFFLLGLHVAELARRAGQRPLMFAWRGTAFAGLASGVLCLGPTLLMSHRGTTSTDIAAIIVTTIPVMVAITMAGLLGFTAWSLGTPSAHAPREPS